MNKSLSARIMDLLQRRQLKGTLAKIALTISCVAIFLITYLLVAPVLTQEWETVCGMEEHVHTEECYTLVPADSAEAAEPTGAVKPAEPAEPAQGGHHHTEECYEEVPAEPGEGGHHHTDECYEEVIVEPAVEGHSHTSDCYEESSSLSCGMSEHSHSDGCLDEEGNQVCGMDEHSHSDSCYETSSELVCGQEETEGREAKTERQLICGQEETDGQETATERRLVCGMEESDGAEETADETAEEPAGEDEAEETGEADAEGQEPEMIRVLTCGKEEHVHSDQCYQKHEISGPEYICGFLTEHAHDDSCYFESGELKCTIPEHTHDDSCLPAQTLGGQNNHIGDGIFPEELPEGYQEANVFQPDGAMFAMTDEDGADQQGIQARVYIPENAFGTEVMFVPQPLDETDEAYAAFAAKLAETEDYDNLTAMDLGFVAADEEFENYGNFLEPNTESGPVYVRLTVPMEISEETELAFWHYVNDGEEAAEGAAEKVTADFTYEDGVLTVDFAADSFSAFAITTRAQAAEGSNSVTWGATVPAVTPVTENGVTSWDVSDKTFRYLRIPVKINVSGLEAGKVTLPYSLDLENAGRNGYRPQLEIEGIENQGWTATKDGDMVTLSKNGGSSGHESLDVYYVFDCWNVVSGQEFVVNCDIPKQDGQSKTESLKGKIKTWHDVKIGEYYTGWNESVYAYSGFGGADKNNAYVSHWNSALETYFGLTESQYDKSSVYDIAPFVVNPQGQQPYDISGTFVPDSGGTLVGAVYMMDSRSNANPVYVKAIVNGNAFNISHENLRVVSGLSDPVDSEVYTLYFLVKYPSTVQWPADWKASLDLKHTGIDLQAEKTANGEVLLYSGPKVTDQIYYADYVSKAVSSTAGLTTLKNGTPATVKFNADFFCLNEARDGFNKTNLTPYRLEAIIDLSYLTNNDKQQLEEGDYRFSSYQLSLIDAPGAWTQGADGTPRVGWNGEMFESKPDQTPDGLIQIYGSTSLIDNNEAAWTSIGTVNVDKAWAQDKNRTVISGSKPINGEYVRLKVVYNSYYTTALRVEYEMQIQPSILAKYGIDAETTEELKLTNWLNYLAYTNTGEKDSAMAFPRYPVTDTTWDDKLNDPNDPYEADRLANTLEDVRQHDAAFSYPRYSEPGGWYPFEYSFRNYTKTTLGKTTDVAGMVVSQVLYDNSGNVVGAKNGDGVLNIINSYSRQKEVTNVSEVVYSISGIVTNGASSMGDLKECISQAVEGSPYHSMKQRYYVLLPEGLVLNTNPKGEHYASNGEKGSYLSSKSTFYKDVVGDEGMNPKVVDSGAVDVPVSDVSVPGLEINRIKINRIKDKQPNMTSEMYWEDDGNATHIETKQVGGRQLVVFEREMDFDPENVTNETNVRNASARFDIWAWKPNNPTHFWGRGLSFSAVPKNGTGTLPEGNDYTADFWCQYLDAEGKPVSMNAFGRNEKGLGPVEQLGNDIDQDTLLYIPINFINHANSGSSQGEIGVRNEKDGQMEYSDKANVDPYEENNTEAKYQYRYKLSYSLKEDDTNTTANDVVLWCNVEDYNRGDKSSEWQGKIAGVDLNETGAKVYVKTDACFDSDVYMGAEKFWLGKDNWTEIEPDSYTGWPNVKAIAFSFDEVQFDKNRRSADVYINMEAPAEDSGFKKIDHSLEYKAYNEFIFSDKHGESEKGCVLVGPTEVILTVKYPLGYVLPSTGGAGSATMCATGMALILAAMGLMYLTLRRSRKQREGGNV